MPGYADAVYVFDLDGVITDPRDTSVDEVVVGRIGHVLGQGGHVAVNTGRSFVWVQENLVARLQASAGPGAFERLYIVCEKGGESRLWQGGVFVSQPSRFALEADAAEITRRLYEDRKAELNTMFWDATKRTMITIEKYPEAGMDEFKVQQAQFSQLLRQGLGSKAVKVDATTIATDVESPLAGKHAGAELVYEWVAKNTPVEHDTFTCFGDSVSDYEMARYFAQHGAATTFVYVGEPSAVFDEEPRVQLIRTKALYAAGTREYFEQTR
jgi:hydroxymethylpyrimidine pyrophosphatase-like HAD family hydrolase